MKVTVTFKAQDRLLEAGLFIPERNQDEEPLAAILIEGAMTGAGPKFSEQVGRKLCDEGYVCMVLDHAFYNEDNRSAHSWESPSKRVVDILAALSFLKDNNLVNPERVVALGVSVGAEYLAQALERSDFCKGFVIIDEDRDNNVDLAARLEIPSIRITDYSYELAAEDASNWIATLLQYPAPLSHRDFAAWNSLSE
ncbi:dienelactone hydrolase family protein [Bdellovibrio sp. HCB274]|uniref:dienelactone hydrolase family protein n=1 Tax=Bdellovibrio sp. HCB274 TaxID=3394361 RepID=UPI0039B41607